MSLKLAVDCDSCGKGIDEGAAIVCWKCYEEIADDLEAAKQEIVELETKISELEQDR